MELSNEELYQKISSLELEFQEIREFFNEKESNLTKWAQEELNRSRKEEEYLIPLSVFL